MKDLKEQLNEIMDKCQSPTRLPEHGDYTNGKDWAVDALIKLFESHLQKQVAERTEEIMNLRIDSNKMDLKPMRNNTHNQSKTMEEKIREICTYRSELGEGTAGYSLSEEQFKKLFSLFTSELTSLRSKVEKEAVLKYILSLGWQDTDNEYVKEVLKDADDIAKELDQMILGGRG
jgi:hypothetical protein